MKATSLPNLNRETTSFPNFFTLYQDVDHDDHMTLNNRPNIDHGDDTEASETSPFNDILSLSPLVSSNEIGFSAAPRSVMMFHCESTQSTLPTSSVGSNQFSGDSGARSEGTSAAQLWRDRNNHPDLPEHQFRRAFNMREKKSINPELWQACAGPLVNLPAAGTHVVYFPQGHCEQVAASMRKDVDAQIPNCPNLPSKLYCLLHNVTLHADPDTDEVYAEMTLQPVPSCDKDALLKSELSMKINKPQTEFFCKTLTASDTFTPGGQPKRHLLSIGWSRFVRGKRLVAGDSVLFIRDEKQQLLLGFRRANRQPSSVLSSESLYNGILAAAAHAVANNNSFTIFYNPRTSPSEFVIPLAKYDKAVYSNQISLGMRFGMMFETEESGTRRYMGTITGITDLDPAGWKDSQWRSLQVGWDESTAGERRNRVSVWEIEPVAVASPSFIFPTPPSQEGLNK
ncbi:hypothetical protein Vadar_027574 [Vaccinium darrowii]|uniref:Uncharacterized protein n=1 Tax=Vaccinium darrowii TaxID=229202 RepID=A0ACB7Y9Q1_9ERIC|nr:hypothetical protein Vadar_027574 [Vaccinium darrowii]